MFKNWDIGAGGVGVFATVTLDSFNKFLATLAGILTVALLSLRVRSAWINRNKNTNTDED